MNCEIELCDSPFERLWASLDCPEVQEGVQEIEDVNPDLKVIQWKQRRAGPSSLSRAGGWLA